MSKLSISINMCKIYSADNPRNGEDILCPINEFSPCIGNKCAKFTSAYHICYMCEHYNTKGNCESCRFYKFVNQDDLGFCTL